MKKGGENAYAHAVSLFSAERGAKQARNRFQVLRRRVRSIHPAAGWGRRRVFESNWDKVRLSSPDSSLSARGLPGFLLLDWHAVCLPLPASALFHWMSQFLIDVFSKALLVQSLPVLVFFREITNCSAKSISELQTLGRTPSSKTSPRYLGDFDGCGRVFTCIKKLTKQNQKKKTHIFFVSNTRSNDSDACTLAVGCTVDCRVCEWLDAIAVNTTLP